MSTSLDVMRAALRGLATMSPRVAAQAALPLFVRIGGRMPVDPADAPTMERARLDEATVAGVDGRGVRLTVYTWGTGYRVVLLAHGWQGRTSQFAALVRDLLYEGFRVVAFDAPAHGSSGGRRAYLVDWIDAIRLLERGFGPFHAVIGHSFGALAALVATAGGVSTGRVVAISAPADADALLAAFGRLMRLDEPTAAALRTTFAHRYFPGDPDPFPRVSALHQPLPAGTELLVVHDRGDRKVPYEQAARIAAANPGARLVTTEGLGHARILAAVEMLDPVLEFLAEPVAAGQSVDSSSSAARVTPPSERSWSATRPAASRKEGPDVTRS